MPIQINSSRKVVLVTGASRGIGLLAARTLAESGHSVYAAMRNLNGRNSVVAEELGDWAADNDLDVEPIEMDVKVDESVVEAIASVEMRQPIDVLVNNAGVMPTGVTEAFTLDQVKACFDVNVYGAVRATRAVLPYMRNRRSGALIHISSAAGRLAIPFFGVYCASKWALEAYAETLRYELEDFGIESVIVEPSGHRTDLVKTAPAPNDEARRKAYGAMADGRERLLGMFETMFAAGETITDAQNIANRILELVETSGGRPIRTTVGADMGVATVNEGSGGAQAALIDSLRPAYKELADAT